MQYSQDKSVPVTTAWHVLRLQVKEWPPIWRVDVNILNKQSRTDEKGVVLQLGGWVRCEQLLTIKNDML